MAMASGGFVIESEWYWRIFEGDPVFGAAEAAAVARAFLRPLAWLARHAVAIGAIRVDDGGDGVSFGVAERPVAIRCRGLRVERFVEAINRGFVEAEVDLAF